MTTNTNYRAESTFVADAANTHSDREMLAYIKARFTTVQARYDRDAQEYQITMRGTEYSAPCAIYIAKSHDRTEHWENRLDAIAAARHLHTTNMQEQATRESAFLDHLSEIAERANQIAALAEHGNNDSLSYRAQIRALGALADMARKHAAHARAVYEQRNA